MPHSRKRNSHATLIMDDLRRIVRVLRESSRAAERSVGLSGAQLYVLHTLSLAERLSVNELADRVRTHQSTVSVVVRRLVDRGLIRRHASNADARRVELALTARGRLLLRRAPGAAQERLVAGIERLDESARKQLARSLQQLVRAMGLDEEPATMLFDDTDERQPVQAPSKSRKVAGPRRRSVSA
jgi:DNA-binding MarR family transcriptional regulator